MEKQDFNYFYSTRKKPYREADHPYLIKEVRRLRRENPEKSADWDWLSGKLATLGFNQVIDEKIDGEIFTRAQIYKESFLEFLLSEHHRFDFFITLTFNKQSNSVPEKENWRDLPEPNQLSTTTPSVLKSSPVDFAQGRNALKRWQASVDRLFLGRTWSKAPMEERLFFIAVPELGRSSKRMDNNLHYHLLVRVPYEPLSFEQEAPSCWTNIIPSGEADIQQIGPTKDDYFRTRNYLTKEIMLDDGHRNFIVSTEFQTR